MEFLVQVRQSGVLHGVDIASAGIELRFCLWSYGYEPLFNGAVIKKTSVCQAVALNPSKRYLNNTS